MKAQHGYLVIDHNRAKIGNIDVNRIQIKQHFKLERIGFNRVEDRTQIHKHGCKDIIKILDVFEDHIRCGKNQPYPDIENEQTDNRVYQQQKLPRESDPVKGHEYKEYDQGQAEIHERRNIAGEQEHIFRDIYFGKDGRIHGQRGHPATGSIPEIEEDQIAGKHIDYKVRSGSPEEMRKDHCHHEQCQKRRQHTPEDTEDSTLVLLLKITFHQLFK